VTESSSLRYSELVQDEVSGFDLDETTAPSFDIKRLSRPFADEEEAFKTTDALFNPVAHRPNRPIHNRAKRSLSLLTSQTRRLNDASSAGEPRASQDRTISEASSAIEPISSQQAAARQPFLGEEDDQELIAVLGLSPS
jgi:hypothetical protein